MGNCQTVEAALGDYVDGALSPESVREIEEHLAACEGCAAYLADIREGMVLLQELEPVEAPPVLINRLLHQIPQRSFGLRGWMARLFEPVLQPRVVMGAMMTVLSLAMMSRCAGLPARSLTAADLDPVKIWGAFDTRVHRVWDRTVKTYENIRVVYELRSRISEWRQEQDEQDSAAADAATAQALRNRQLSAHGAPAAPQSGKQAK